MDHRRIATAAASSHPVPLDGGEVFDHRFRFAAPAPQPYFMQKVDVEKATLEVNVFRPNLIFIFTHSRALEAHLPPSEIASRLTNKTTGFLAVVSPLTSPSPPRQRGERPRLSPGRHTVLAWAESGHGSGKNGDIVDACAGNHALANRAWARRVTRLALALGQRIGSVCDAMGSREQGGETRGIFQAAHVEVKLAAHAAYLLLHLFAPLVAETPTDDAGSDAHVTALRRRLMALRRARWSDGSRPAFDIVVSRHPCPLCGFFVSRLSRLTGIQMNLVWGQRLVPAVHNLPSIPLKVGKRAAGEKQGGDGSERNGNADDDDDEGEDDKIMDPVTPVTRTRTPAPITPTKHVATDAGGDNTSPPARPRRHPRAPPPRPVPGGIAKPLPATPETEPPSWMAPAVRQRRRHQRYTAGWGRRTVVDDEDEEEW